MLIDPATLTADFPRLEEIEKASTRFVTQAMLNFREEAAQIYQNERDKPQDIGEDITREALDRLGVSKIDQRLFGKMDYKRARVTSFTRTTRLGRRYLWTQKPKTSPEGERQHSKPRKCLCASCTSGGAQQLMNRELCRRS